MAQAARRPIVLLRSILLMGVPVSGKNMFPSNIAGLPT
jgi:2-oxoglutarate ferredoxin oxidoreductase subunit alpha